MCSVSRSSIQLQAIEFACAVPLYGGRGRIIDLPSFKCETFNCFVTLMQMAKNGVMAEWMININAALIVTIWHFSDMLHLLSALASILIGMTIAIIGGMTAGMATSGACLGGIALF